LEASGSAPVVPQAIHAARKGGRIVLVGLPVAASTINFFHVVASEKEIIGSLSHVYDEDYATKTDGESANHLPGSAPAVESSSRKKSSNRVLQPAAPWRCPLQFLIRMLDTGPWYTGSG
jgi:hypothetical protein